MTWKLLKTWAKEQLSRVLPERQAKSERLDDTLEARRAKRAGEAAAKSSKAAQGTANSGSGSG